MFIWENIGRTMRNERVARSLEIDHVAQAISVADQTTIMDIERGDFQAFLSPALVSLYKYYHLPLENILKLQAPNYYSNCQIIQSSQNSSSVQNNYFADGYKVAIDAYIKWLAEKDEEIFRLRKELNELKQMKIKK